MVEHLVIAIVALFLGASVGYGIKRQKANTAPAYPVVTQNQLLYRHEKVFASKGDAVAIEMLTEAWNSFVGQGGLSDTDRREFANGIHRCQLVVAFRVAQKDHPDIFPKHHQDETEEAK